MSIKDDIKRCEQLIKPENASWIGLSNQSAISHILKDYTMLEEIEEEHKKENGELREKVKKLEETIADYQRMYCRTMNDGISKQKIKELKENIHNIMDKNGMTRAYQITIDEQFKELLQESEDK